ncbi:MAG: ABC transporter substrate-binding protein [Actinomycetaceae bacterium]|nr:ABC transporter substrate-binding protein [Actinomycetaceae bacterium]
MRKSFAAIAAVAALSLTLAGCGGGAGGGADAADGKGYPESKTIYLVSKGFQHQFWQAVKQGALDAGEEAGYKVEFVGPDKETEVDKQMSMLQTAFDSKPAAIGFAALDSGAAADLLKKINDKGVPVVAFDSGVESDIPVTTVQTDNKAAAGEAAKHLAELVGNKGKVGLVCHDQVSQTGIQRCDGFMEWMKDNAPDIEVITPQYAGDVVKAADAAKAIMQANPDIVGMYGTNEAAATGVAQGVDEAGMVGKLKVVGFDSGKAQIEAIKSGAMAGAVTQAPVLIGSETVKAAIKAIKGESLPKIIDSGFKWYDATNIEDPEIASNLYE